MQRDLRRTVGSVLGQVGGEGSQLAERPGAVGRRHPLLELFEIETPLGGGGLQTLDHGIAVGIGCSKARLFRQLVAHARQRTDGGEGEQLINAPQFGPAWATGARPTRS